MRGRGFLLGTWVVVAVAVAAGARAEVPPPPPAAAPAELASLLPRVATYAARFEEMTRRGTFTLRGRMDELASDGVPSATKEVVLRSVATPGERRTEILHDTEDGADKTAEARQKTAMFVDHVDVTMRFDLATPLGRAPSEIAFEARGGLLFFRKRVRVSGTISDPALGF